MRNRNWDRIIALLICGALGLLFTQWMEARFNPHGNIVLLATTAPVWFALGAGFWMLVASLFLGAWIRKGGK